MFAIDVSKWNGWRNDFEKAKKDGVEAVIIRCNYGYSSNFKNMGYDETFENNFKGAKSAGLLVGVYTAAYAVTIEQAKEEARRCLNVLKGRNLELPIFIDAEFEEFAKGDNITDKINAYMQVIKDAGYKYGVYANLNWFRNYINQDKLLDGCNKWIAHYNSSLYKTNPNHYKGQYDLWQYGSEGYSVDGIGQASGGVDVNIIYKDYSIKKASWKRDAVGWWYQNADGTYKKSEWFLYLGKYYYFDERGYMLHDQFITLNNETFYLDDWGVCNLNYVKKIDGKLYAFDHRGALIKNKNINESGEIL